MKDLDVTKKYSLANTTEHQREIIMDWLLKNDTFWYPNAVLLPIYILRFMKYHNWTFSVGAEADTCATELFND